MRGTLGGGFDIGGGLGRTTQAYASEVAMSYDPIKQVYVGEMLSRGGVYRVEGPDRNSITMQVGDILRDEYEAMMHEVATQKPQHFGSHVGRTVTVHGKQAHVTHHKAHGVPVLMIAAADAPHHEKKGMSLKDALDITDLVMAIISAMHGQWLSVLQNAMGMAAEDYLTKAGLTTEKKVYAAVFGGILITATSRAMLKRKLQLQKNRRIQLIMNHMRDHEKNREEASSTSNIGLYVAGRLLEKKEEAQNNWRSLVSPQGQETRWRDRSRNLRHTIGKKRSRAQQLWTERSGY